MAAKDVVKAGDVSKRVGVEVIRARQQVRLPTNA